MASSTPEREKKATMRGAEKMWGTLLKELNQVAIWAPRAEMTCGVSLSKIFFCGKGESAEYQPLGRLVLMLCLSAHSWLKRLIMKQERAGSASSCSVMRYEVNIFSSPPAIFSFPVANGDTSNV